MQSAAKIGSAGAYSRDQRPVFPHEEASPAALLSSAQHQRGAPPAGLRLRHLGRAALSPGGDFHNRGVDSASSHLLRSVNKPRSRLHFARPPPVPARSRGPGHRPRRAMKSPGAGRGWDPANCGRRAPSRAPAPQKRTRPRPPPTGGGGTKRLGSYARRTGQSPPEKSPRQRLRGASPHRAFAGVLLHPDRPPLGPKWWGSPRRPQRGAAWGPRAVELSHPWGVPAPRDRRLSAAPAKCRFMGLPGPTSA